MDDDVQEDEAGWVRCSQEWEPMAEWRLTMVSVEGGVNESV